MERYYIDLSEIQTRNQLYDCLAEALPLPDGCGRNLDALYDMFTGEMGEARIFFSHGNEAESRLDGYFVMFQTMCREAADANPKLQIFFI